MMASGGRNYRDCSTRFLLITTAVLVIGCRHHVHGKDYRNNMSSDEVPSSSKHDTSIGTEPSCEELKAMWRFSKRQSRAAEITNEIPTYRDPFSYNVWDSYYPRTRSIGGGRIGGTGGRYKNRPVYYGKVVHEAPSFRVQDVVEKNRAFEEVARMYGTMHRGSEAPRRRVTAFRLGGGGHIHVNAGPMTPQSGSFQHLKELIRTERARELQEQRMAEEVAARAAALKELSRGNSRNRHLQYDRELKYMAHSGEDDIRRERERELERMALASQRPGSNGVVAFPDLLAPAAVRPEMLEPDDPDPIGSSALRQYSRSTAHHRHRQPTQLYQAIPYGTEDLEGELLL